MCQLCVNDGNTGRHANPRFGDEVPAERGLRHVSIYVPPSVRDDIRGIARENGMTYVQVIRRALEALHRTL